MKTIKFKKSRQGLGYFAGDIAELEDEVVQELIEEGFAVLAEDAPVESDLPETLKSREALIKAGLNTIAAVLAAKETLTDIKGIGEATAKEIIETLESLS